MKSPSLLASFKYAWEGIAHAFRTQRNFRIHVLVSSAVGVAGLLLRVGATEWAALILTIGLVFLAELFNTAIEAIVDHVAPEFHALAKIAKDCAAAGVLLASILAVVLFCFMLMDLFL